MSLDRARELLAEHDRIHEQMVAEWRARGMWDGASLERLYRDRDAKCHRLLVEAQVEVAEVMGAAMAARAA